MFDIGYSELLLTGLVALLVLGPEKLPGAMRTTGLWIGRIRRSFDRIKLELEAEVGMDELRRQIHNDGILEEARRLQRDLNDVVQTTQDTWRDAQHGVLPDEVTAPVAAAIAPSSAVPSTAAPSTAAPSTGAVSVPAAEAVAAASAGAPPNTEQSHTL